jgi:hypothetical protein
MQDDLSDQIPEPPQIRFLRVLVTVLTTVMIGGVVLIIVLIVMRFNQVPNLLPDEVVLPDGKSAMAVTQGTDWFAVVTTDDEIMIFDRITGQLRQSVTITPAASN